MVSEHRGAERGATICSSSQSCRRWRGISKAASPPIDRVNSTRRELHPGTFLVQAFRRIHCVEIDRASVELENADDDGVPQRHF